MKSLRASFGTALSCFAVAAFMPGCGGDSGNDGQRVWNISAEEALQTIIARADDPAFTVLDVRTPAEFAGEHVAGAVNLDYYSADFRSNLAQLDTTKAYLVYCASGTRSAGATAVMEELGFTEVYNVLGGMSAMKQFDDWPLVSNNGP